MIPRIGFGLFLLGLLVITTPSLALQASLAGVVDWHRPLIGVPLLDPTPPTFADTPGGRRILAITRKNVLACLESQTGVVIWRHLLEPSDPVVSYHVKDDGVLLLSGPSGATARLFNVTTGQALWERSLVDVDSPRMTVPVHLGTDVAFTDEGAVAVLSDGRRVSKLSQATGEVLWSMDAPGAGSTVLFKQLLVSDNVVHVLALTSSFASQTLTTLSLDLATSVPIAEFTQIPSIVTLPEDALLAASDTGGSARVVWFEHGRIRTVYLGRSGQLGSTKDLLPGKGKKYARILPGVRSEGIIMGQQANGAVDIIDVRDGGKIVTTFDGSEDSPDRSSSVYSAAMTTQGVICNRVYWSFSRKWSVFETTLIKGSDDIMSTGYSFAFDTPAHGVILATAASSPVSANQLRDKSQLSELVLLTSSGALQLVTPESIAWTREESLSELAGIKFIDLGEPEVEETRHLLAEEGFLARVARHLVELKDLPGYVARFVKRVTTSSYSSTIATTPLSLDHLHRDEFGFQKLIIAVTGSGKVIAMDSANGNAVWKRNLGMTSANGTELAVKGVWKVRELSEQGEPMMAVVAIRTRGDGVKTVAFHMNAYSGLVEGEKDPATGLPKGKELFEGTMSFAFLIPFKNCGTNIQVLAVIDESTKLHIFPSCKKVAGDFAAVQSQFFFTGTQRSVSGSSITGYTPMSSGNDTNFHAMSVWSKSFAPGEAIVSAEPVESGALASFGRVLGDKSTLYKYLNPHLTVVTTSRENGESGVYVVNSASGEVVHSAFAAGIELKAAMMENWLVYAWKGEQGWRLASVELYEDREAGKMETPGTSSFAEQSITMIGKSFMLPAGIRALGFTTSRFGIAAKDLIYVNARNQVSSISRRLLDPRRPTGPPTKAEKEEMLVPYDPVVGYDVKRVISHRYEILGAEAIVASPSLLESTPLILTYGLDLFFTRGVNPSGTFDILSDSFNKVQLLLTLGLLSVGIAMAGPAVRRKTLRAKWY